jgi:serine/threonine protein kinase
MEIINVTSKKFEKLKLLDIPSEITNTEAKIFYIKRRGELKVFKNLFRIKGSTFANKLYTLEMLDNNKDILPSEYVLPDYLISVDGVINGFAMPYIHGTNLSLLLNNPKIDNQVKIDYLIKVGKLLERLDYIRMNDNLNVYLNDLHSSNFLIDKDGNLKVLDLDSSKICDNKPFPAKYLMPSSLVRYTPDKYTIYNKKLIDKSNDDYYDYKQELGYLDADKNTDLFCYNIMILNFLYGDNIVRMDMNDFYSYIMYLKKLDLDENLIRIFDKLLAQCDNESPVDYLSTLTDSQIGRANHNVYKLSKK